MKNRSKMIGRFLFLFYWFTTVNSVISSNNEDYNDIEDKRNSEVLIRKLWGIQDVTTSAGKLFRYKIPPDAFSGKITHYEVEGATDDKKFPKWLTYDRQTAVLEGVPSVEDIGDTVITVRAFDTKQHFIGDVFTIEVFPLFEKNINNKKKCKKGDDIVMISVVIDKNMRDISASQRVDALKNLARFLGINYNLFVLLPQQFNVDLLSEALLIAGHGNVKHSLSNSSTILTWQIGCNEKIWPEKLRLVDLVKQYARDGTLSEVLQLPVVEWRIISSENPFSRGRRHARVTNKEGDNNNSTNIEDLDENVSDDGGSDDYDDSANPNDKSDNDDDDLLDSDVNLPSQDSLPSATSGVRSVNSSLSPDQTRGAFNSLIPSGNDNPDADKSKRNENEDNDDDSSTDLPDDTIDKEPAPASPSSSVSISTGGGTSSKSFLPSSPSSSLLSSTSLANVSSSPSSNNVPPTATTTVSSSLLTATTDVPSVVVISAKNAHPPPPIVEVARKPPEIRRELVPLTIEAGKSLKYLIPEDTFVDGEDGNTRNLSLILHNKIDNGSIAWVQLNPVTQEFFLLPTEQDVSDWEFALEARDSDTMSTNTTVRINVRNQKDARTVNFQMSLHLTFHNETHMTNNHHEICDGSNYNENCYDRRLAWTYRLLNVLSTVYGDSSPGKITVLSITYDPFVFTWTNDTLPSDSCDKNIVAYLINTLTEPSFSINIKQWIKEKIGPDVTVDKLTWSRTEHCDMIPLPHPGTKPSIDFHPIVRNLIPPLNVTVGELYLYKIPEDAFLDVDLKDQPQKLKLILRTIDNKEIPEDSWLQFDSTNHEIFALPLTTDYNETEFQLVCKDVDGYEANQVIKVDIKTASKIMYSVEFSMVLDANYTNFISRLRSQRLFVERLAQLFDSNAGDTSSIVISGFSPGSVYVTWHNKSLPVNRCTESEILKLRQVLLTDDEIVEKRVNDVMLPDFPVLAVNVTPIGICEGGLTELHALPADTTGKSQEIHAIIYYNKYFTTFIVPALIVAIMLFVAGMIACILYKRQHRGKLSIADDERRSFRKKGIPVIFQDELEERLEPTNKTPIIMKQEKPPLPPPEYQKMIPLPTTALLSDYEDHPMQQRYSPSSHQHQHQQQPTTANSSFNNNNKSSNNNNNSSSSSNSNNHHPHSGNNSADRNSRKQSPIYRKPPPYGQH